MNYLIGHLVGDYLLQTDWQAQGKKRSSLICAVHCGLYTLSIALFTGWPSWALAVVLVTHFAQDRTNFVRWWMGVVGQDTFADKLGPWSVIVVDNVMHLVVLYFLDRHVRGVPMFNGGPF